MSGRKTSCTPAGKDVSSFSVRHRFLRNAVAKNDTGIIFPPATAASRLKNHMGAPWFRRGLKMPEWQAEAPLASLKAAQK